MKPLNIVLLVLAGALGGAVVMKVVEHPKAAPVPVAQTQAPAQPAQSQAPVAAPAPPATPSVEETAAKAEPKPSPVAKQKVPEKRVRSIAAPAVQVPVTVAQVEQPKAAAPAQTAPTLSVPEPAAPAPAPAVVETPAPPERDPAPVAVPPPAPAPERHTVTLNAGLLVPVRLVDGLSSERNANGDSFSGTLDKELVVDGFVIAERGSRVEGRVVASDKGGKVRGTAALAVELTRIRLSDGQTITVQTDSFEKHAEDSRAQDATKVGVGAAIGAAIGAMAGGGKGAAIGAGVGGGAGAGDVLLTRGKPATLPSETRINFRLRAPVTVTERRS